MKIVIPMAGMGKRMRPHTLTVPKPLIRIAGKPIVQRLVEQIAAMVKEDISEIAFVIGDFGKEVEDKLLGIAEKIGARGKILYQEQALGTAHAVYCAKESLNGKVAIAFADTLFNADFTLDENQDGLIWIKTVEDPSAFGVVKTNESNIITAFVEKPTTFVSDKAIIGIYYFRQGEKLRDEIHYLLENNIMKNGEYQLTDALQRMTEGGIQLYTGDVKEWMDCGNKNATVETNKRILEIHKKEDLISPSAGISDSIIRKPCFIGKDASISNSIIGPHVSIGEGTKIDHSIVTNSIIQSNTIISNANIDNSMIGNWVEYKGTVHDVSIGDYARLANENKS